MKCNQAYTPGIFHDVYKILGLPVLMTVSSLAVSFEEYDRGSVSLFPHFLFKYLLFSSDIGYFELKTDGGGGGGERQKGLFLSFMFWSALILRG